MTFLLGPFLVWLPKVFFGFVFLLALFFYFSHKRQITKTFQLLIILVISFRFFYALLETLGQYYVWSRNTFTQLLLDSPLGDIVPLPFSLEKLPGIFDSRLGYFLFYSYGHFWLNAFISLVVAFVFYLILQALKKHDRRFFEEGEVKLGFLTALIVGWPHFVVFLPLIFIFVVFASLFRRIFFGEHYTTLGIPFLAAAFVAMVWGGRLIDFLGLTVFKI